MKIYHNILICERFLFQHAFVEIIQKYHIDKHIIMGIYSIINIFPACICRDNGKIIIIDYDRYCIMEIHHHILI